MNGSRKVNAIVGFTAYAAVFACITAVAAISLGSVVA